MSDPSPPRHVRHLVAGIVRAGLRATRRSLALRARSGMHRRGDAARAANPALRAAARHAEALARRAVIGDRREHPRTRARSGCPTSSTSGHRSGSAARVGEAIALVPPFGASLIAWDDDEGIQTWFNRADPPLAPAEVADYRAALAGIRRRGFSVTLVTARQPVLIDALERLADDSGGGAHRARDEAVRQMTHSEYLAAEIEPDRTVRVAQVSAPVFQADGRVRRHDHVARSNP